MSLAKKLTRWKEQQFITQIQCDQILAFERQQTGHTFWRTAFIIAGLLIGLGICLLIASNWDGIGAIVKLTADFFILGGLFYAAWWCAANQRKKLIELFAILSFLMIGGTIGLVGQIFNLDGGWHSFALAWTLLGIPFVAVSRSSFFNMIWLCLLASTFPNDWWERFSEYIFGSFHPGVIASVIGFCLLNYAGKKLDEITHNYSLLPKAFATLMMWSAYIIVWFVGLRWGINWGRQAGTMLLANLFVFGFFAIRMFWAVKAQNLISFRRNAIMIEIYIFILFLSGMGSLLRSGIGFIIGGLSILGMIYLFRYTSRYIKTLEIFK